MKYMILLSGDLKVKGVIGDGYHPMPDTSEGSGRSLPFGIISPLIILCTDPSGSYRYKTPKLVKDTISSYLLVQVRCI